MFIQCPFHQDSPSPVEMKPYGIGTFKCDTCGFVAKFESIPEPQDM